jgi:hypothetical protein
MGDIDEKQDGEAISGEEDEARLQEYWWRGAHYGLHLRVHEANLLYSTATKWVNASSLSVDGEARTRAYRIRICCNSPGEFPNYRLYEWREEDQLSRPHEWTEQKRTHDFRAPLMELEKYAITVQHCSAGEKHPPVSEQTISATVVHLDGSEQVLKDVTFVERKSSGLQGSARSTLPLEITVGGEKYPWWSIEDTTRRHLQGTTHIVDLLKVKTVEVAVHPWGPFPEEGPP